MKIETITARKAIDNAFLQESITETEFETFRQRLLTLLNQADDAVEEGESEEHLKGLIKPFFNNTNFEEDHYINTKKRQDLAIHNGKTRKSNVGVIIEAKRPSNSSEMITGDDLNRKAFHESILYYLRERIDNGNEDIKHIIITDVYHWYIFDAQDFERHFYESKKLTGWYEEWRQGQKVSSRTKFVYNHLAEFVEELDGSMKAAELALSSYRRLLEKDELSRDEQKKLVPVFKLFTPTHLLKQPFASDSNELNKAFYRELLYIMGLKEYKEKGTHYITRLDEENRQHASLIENTITQLKSLNVISRLPNRSEFGEDEDEQLFNVAIQLLITWINRILFLKLLEAQLFKYHREDDRFRFLNHRDIKEYDGLNKLFFQVLAVPVEDRSERINKHFGHIPFLNSSLFDVAEIEQHTIRISELEDGLQMPVYARSKIRNRDGQRLKGESLSALEYLLRFLDAYNFNTEGTAEVQKEAKTLINASVLGRIFEKINGYKDGSFFTPGYITEYMCRETIRRAVVQKFKGVLKRPHPESLSPGERDIGRGGKSGMSSEYPRTKLPDELLKNARHLRKNQTEAEELLWQLLRNRQLADAKFRRQHPIEDGLVLDFYCHQHKLAIEVDGGYHDEEEQQVADSERTGILNQKGIRVIRFTNEQVLDETETVLEEIKGALDGPHPESLSHGERDIGRGEQPNLTFADIHNAIGRDISMEEANDIVNSITICDPAVGSGHFLVSALNELIAIKSELGIFCYEDEQGNYRRFRDVEISVDNDELSIAVGQDPFFEYRVFSEWKDDGQIERTVGPDTQRLQKALFREKNILIENCLFGVDINPNSVNICRLRLWIELLKHAYYKEDGNTPHSSSAPEGERTRNTDNYQNHPSPTGREMSEGQGEGEKYQQLEVLPNIDINIKQGNSLVSRFDLDADLSQILANNDDLTIDQYKQAVRSYKETGNREDKRALKEQISSIKESFSVGLKELHPVRKKLKKQREILIKEEAKLDLFEGEKKSKKEQKKIDKTKKKIGELEEELEELENASFYDQAFEWRFEFPEVLDEDGNFTGFDAVIGNPPYMGFQSVNGDMKSYFNEIFDSAYGKYDIYVLFVERALQLIKNSGLIHYILPHKFLVARFGKGLRQILSDNKAASRLIHFKENMVFEDATTYTCLFEMEMNSDQLKFQYLQPINLPEFNRSAFSEMNTDQLSSDSWILVSKTERTILEKVTNNQLQFKDVFQGAYQGVVSGDNDAFYIYDPDLKEEKVKGYSKCIDKEVTLDSELVYPLTTGKNSNKWITDNNDIALIYPYKKDDGETVLIPEDELEENYSATYKYLKQIYDRLSSRGSESMNYEKWYALWNSRNFKIFQSPKIITPDVCYKPQMFLDRDQDYFFNDTCYGLSKKDNKTSILLYLGILNSNLIWYFLTKTGNVVRGGYFRFKTSYLEPISFPDKNSTSIINKVDHILTAKKENPEADTSELEEKIDQLVYELYGLSDEEIGIVEESVGD